LHGRVIGDDAIVLNDWLARDLGAKPGDGITLVYSVRSPSGLLDERAADLVVGRIIATSGIGADRTLTPDFPMVTGAKSLRDWDPPKEFGFRPERIRPTDEEYWKRHHAAPKAFVRLETAQRLWGTPFGDLTSIRFPAGSDPIASVVRSLAPASGGLVSRPVREDQLRAGRGSTDFAGLFAGLSLFLVAGAALLVVLLMLLSVETRARQVGLLFACGFTLARVRRLFLTEALLVLAGGSFLGALLSPAYAALVLVGLRTLWSGAVGEMPLSLHAHAMSVAGALGGGIVVGGIAVWIGTSALGRLRPAETLSGRRSITPARAGGGRGAVVTAAAAFACAAVLCVVTLGSDRASTAVFFLGGFLLLAGFLAAFRAWLSREAGVRRLSLRALTLASRAIRNAARNPRRSMLVAGLLACGVFVVAATGAMRSGVSKEAGGLLVAETDIPVPYDLRDARAREHLVPGDPELWEDARFAALRVSRGEDASCRNLYRPRDPRVASAPPALRELGAFSFVSAISNRDDAWSLLDVRLPDGAIPAVVDDETARWILHRGLGDTVEITDGNGRRRELCIVALLRKSIFQSEILVAEGSFRSLFPGEPGFREFLVRAPRARAGEVRRALEKGLADFGITVETAEERLASYDAIADSYIAAFQALGGLGLLLGSLGLLVVLLRNVVERRGEIALLGAVGFPRRAIAFLVAGENVFLLLVGLLAGTLSALVAVAPELARGRGHLSSVAGSLFFFLLAGTAITALLAASSSRLVRLPARALRRE
jgi:ABC-type lipoprotein release transport system permease subunit